ncbi:MAG: amidohydrolase [Bacteroidetes bacterium]|nr:amidohydrolase [Bacteroidota bacterium]
MNKLSITLIQSTLHWQDVAANLQMLSEKISAIKNPTDLILLPEMFSTGFSMNVETQAEEMNNSWAIEWMKKTAAEKNCVVTGSLMLRDKKKFFNRLVWMRPDGSFETYDKRHLFSFAQEEKTFTSGRERLIVELKGWKICPMICYDLRFPAWSRNRLVESEAAAAAYDLLIYVANWPERRAQAWKYLLIARAIENQTYVAGINRVGNDGNDIYYSGDSMVADALGNILYHREQSEDITTLQLSMEDLTKVRRQFRFLKDADLFNINPKSKFKSH